MIYKGLDEEEAGFLNMITYQQSSRESQLLQQEREEINAFKVHHVFDMFEVLPTFVLTPYPIIM